MGRRFSCATLVLKLMKRGSKTGKYSELPVRLARASQVSITLKVYTWLIRSPFQTYRK